MSYEEFGNKPDTAPGNALNPTVQIVDPAQGVQDELEIRGGDYVLDGVTSGMACTIDAGNDEIDIAAGRVIMAGKRYSGSASVAFVAQATNTYYIYIDSTDDTTPYKAKTTAPTAGEITLCTVLWTLGTTTLSALDDDAKVLGVLPADIVVTVPGTLTTGTKLSIPVLRDMWIEGVEVSLVESGTASGSTDVDVHLGASGSAGTTIFTTAGNRPSIAFDDADFTVAVSGIPDGDRKPDAGEHIDIAVDAIPGGSDSADLTVTIKARYR